ncbi:chemotaxis protein, partial [Rhizobium johnstonii]
AYTDTADYTNFLKRLAHGEFIANEFVRFGKGGRQIWIGTIAENAVVLASDLGERIPHGTAEILVGGQDFTRRGKFD